MKLDDNCVSRLSREVEGITLNREVPLKDYTTFKVGGPCKAMAIVKDVDSLSQLIKWLKKEEIEYFVLGNGSNLLVSDNGYDGLVIKLDGDFKNVTVKGEEIITGSAVMLSNVCKKALEEKLGGLEFAYGIPGTVGGAMVMNAGAYGGEMKDVVSSVEAVTGEGEVITISNENMRFAYRRSVVREKGYIVTRVTYTLKKDDPAVIKEKMDDLMQRRLDKQPLEHPSAGSTFKRPEGYFAGKLIQDAGLAGFRIGGACVSEKHCGFVVNDQKGSAADIDLLIKEVTAKVDEAFNVKLEPEVIRIGKF